jgi:predicted CXXCH cytochrome family protein
LARKRRKSGDKQRSPPQPAASAAKDSSPGGSEIGRLKWQIWIALPVVALIVAVFGLEFHFISGGNSTSKQGGPTVATFVGSETCAGCHRAEAELWRTSQHRHAMDHATDETVLGDFSDASFDYYGMTSRFFRRDNKFFVDTDGPDGKLATFEVKYTFGIEPLQQYLVEFPDGRIQALPLAWDTRPKQQGGQRWFHLYPNEQIKFDDVLHWTKLNQNWNFMCAECHSTGVIKNYDAAHDRFHTTWSEISIGCERCHGQGSRHVEWARSRQSWWPFAKQDDTSRGLAVLFDERNGISWRTDPTSGKPQRSIAPAVLRKEIETCGLCHARRASFAEDWAPGQWLSQTHVVEPVSPGTYHADGQIRDVEEPYNYTPFKQSKMFAAGLTCSDCHEPHSAKLRAPGDGVCLQCHEPDKYASAAHHHHAGVEPALTCASCHMPLRTYMVIDRRHDHSFRVPRPDLSVALSTPNACNDCHTDKSAQWAAAAVERWFGPTREGFQTYAAAFHAARTDQADAAALLAVVAADAKTPAVARAGALTELAPLVSPANIKVAQAGLADPDPVVRIGALDMLENVPATQSWPLASPLLSDPVRGVRIRAASLLASVPIANQPPTDRERFERAATEFVAAQRFNADRPEARATLGNFFARRGQAADAETEYKAALRLEPQYATAAINLADLYRQLGRDAEGESVLRAAIAASPREAAAHHALGLTLIRLKQPDAALAEFRRAAELQPDNARYNYVYAVALNSAGHGDEAIAILKQTLASHPADRDTLLALVTFSRAAGDAAGALGYAERLAAMAPNDQGLTALIQELRRQLTKPN